MLLLIFFFQQFIFENQIKQIKQSDSDCRADYIKYNFVDIEYSVVF